MATGTLAGKQIAGRRGKTELKFKTFFTMNRRCPLHCIGIGQSVIISGSSHSAKSTVDSLQSTQTHGS